MSTRGSNDLIYKTLERGSEILGRKVIIKDSEKEVGNIKDIVFDRVSNQIVALIVDNSDARILSWGGIYAIREDAVVASSDGMVVSAEGLLEADRIVELGKSVIGKQLITTDERKLGKVVDIYFNAHTGKVIGYEITGGIFADAMSDRFFAPAAEIMRFGDDNLFVSAASAIMFEEQIGNLKQSIWHEWQSLLESFEAAMESLDHRNLGEHLRDEASRSQKTIAEITAQVHGQLKQLLAERVVGQAKGYPAQHTALTDDNEFIVVAGQVVTRDVVDLAREHHKEVDLMESVGLDFENIINDNALNLQKVINRYADEWRTDSSAIVDSLRDTVHTLADDVTARLEKSHQ